MTGESLVSLPAPPSRLVLPISSSEVRTSTEKGPHRPLMALRHGFVQGRPARLGLPVVHVRTEGQEDAHQVRVPRFCSLENKVALTGCRKGRRHSKA